MADFEEVNREDLYNLTAEMKAEYDQVTFLHVAGVYPIDANIECRFEVSKNFVPSTMDWVGLFRVGWTSSKDYLYYEYAPWPESDDGSVEVPFDPINSILFMSESFSAF